MYFKSPCANYLLLPVIFFASMLLANFSSLHLHFKESLGDSKLRSKWRTKQDVDFNYLMMYAQTRGHFYCQLEDDVQSKPGMETWKAGGWADGAGRSGIAEEFNWAWRRDRNLEENIS